MILMVMSWNAREKSIATETDPYLWKLVLFTLAIALLAAVSLLFLINMRIRSTRWGA